MYVHNVDRRNKGKIIGESLGLMFEELIDALRLWQLLQDCTWPDEFDQALEFWLSLRENGLSEDQLEKVKDSELLLQIVNAIHAYTSER